jgi:biotin carboxyl carrier protein
MKYQVTIGARTVEVDLSGEGASVDGHPVEVHLDKLPGGPLRHLLIDGASHTLIASPGERRGRWRLTIAGRTVVVDALDERTRAIQAMVGSVEAEAEKSIVAPMPGLVLHVHVEVGQTIVAGQGVIVVEAMKMENELKAPADGVVARVGVAPGQAVEKGTILVVLE